MTRTKLVHDFLDDSASLHPEKKAFFAMGQWHTYGRLDEQANQLARFFIKSGLNRGDRIALLLENSPEYVITYYAILKAGGITVALNTESTFEDIAYIVRDCCVRFLVTGPKLIWRTPAPHKDLPACASPQSRASLERVFLWSSRKPPEHDPAAATVLLPESTERESTANPGVRMIDLDVASIVYTSGSTGKPRGATLSHLNIVSNTRSIAEYLELTSDDRIMVVLPFYYIYGK